MSAQRTPAAHRDEPRKQNKGRPSKSDRVANIPEDAINRIQARRMLVENPLPRSQGDDLAGFYHDRISMGMEMDGQWDPEDDEAVDEEWDQFAQTAKLPDFAKSTRHGYLLTLFKVYLRLYQTTPIVLLSLYYQLRYQATSINGTGHGWVFWKSFCEDLTALMGHPVWEANTKLLAEALAWTVIYRLDDRRPWGGSLEKPCPVLESVLEQVRICGENNQPLPSSLHEMHKSARQRASQRGVSPSIWSDLFMKIGEIARGEPADEPDNNFRILFGYPVLPVTLEDLRHLRDAINATTLGPECDYSVGDALGGWNAEASGQCLPERKISRREHDSISPHGEGSRGTVGPSNSQFEDTASESELSTVSRQRSVLSSRLRPGGDGGSETGGTFDDNFEEEAESDSTPALWASARDEIHTSEALPQQPSTASPGESLQNSRVLSEISELRRENRELRDGQQRLYKLMEESQKRHNESMGSIQAQLRELIEANQASNL
ncbi:hypothetical protein FVEG_06609 [Fusarium verticillioides 7600]|uniref:Uncharacterized protein n=1 Tax=Gibberella moniliformis (strain M3125 / FGSC 7600) TaxID=334819 RepID=W7MMW0_GIBM7|nr:hypothetical protein FVEG_06609 [Fusarium verticillioides 7600]EWG45982.1 hypothetical protein FVEG_06609 [Fusarium verticillioides 7600]RBQ85991.1 hypothetical protein FVER53263_06609 [Fusarium verticillioides]